MTFALFILAVLTVFSVVILILMLTRRIPAGRFFIFFVGFGLPFLGIGLLKENLKPIFPINICLADIFIVPSVNEGVPISLVNAIRHHIPVITSNLPQLVDIVIERGYGLVFLRGDSFDLYNNILNLISNESLRLTYSTNCQKYQINTWSDSANDYINLYKGLLET